MVSGPGATPAMCLAASACAFFLGHIPAFAGWISEVRPIPLRVSSIHAAARMAILSLLAPIASAMKFPLAALLFLGAAHAAPVWTLGPNDSGESLVFHDQQGPCVGKAQVVVWSKPGHSPVPGCYRIEDGAVFVAFLDGDHMRPFPVGMLVKARSL